MRCLSVSLASRSCGRELAKVERKTSSSEVVRRDGLSEEVLLPIKEVSFEVIRLT
jgi:hypothetical protein